MRFGDDWFTDQYFNDPFRNFSFGNQQPIQGPRIPKFEFQLNQEPEQPRAAGPGAGLDWRSLVEQQPTPALKAYQDFLEKMPKRDDYNLGKVGKIGAALSGFASGWQGGPDRAFQTVRTALDRPYKEAVTDWAGEGSVLKERADLESREMANRIKVAQDQRRQMMDDLKFRLETSKTQAEIQNLQSLAGTRGFRLGVDENGNQILFDLQNPNQPPRVLFRTNEDTPGARQQRHDSTLDNQWSMAELAQQGANARNSATIAGANSRNQATLDAAAARQRAEHGFEKEILPLRNQQGGRVSPNQDWTIRARAVQDTLQDPLFAAKGFSKFLDNRGGIRNADQISAGDLPLYKEFLQAVSLRERSMRNRYSVGAPTGNRFLAEPEPEDQ